MRNTVKLLLIVCLTVLELMLNAGNVFAESGLFAADAAEQLDSALSSGDTAQSEAGGGCDLARRGRRRGRHGRRRGRRRLHHHSRRHGRRRKTTRIIVW